MTSSRRSSETHAPGATPDSPARRQLGDIRRVVVKVGSAVIAGKGRLRPKVVSILAHDLAVLKRKGYEPVLVVSGAVAAGYKALGATTPPGSVVERQAAASVGQHRLMATFSKAFARHRVHVAQLLMSAEDIENRRRFLSARHTLQVLLAKGVVPIVNENDALSDDQVKVGDNDHLAALITSVASADLLVILSSVPGLFADGVGEVLPEVDWTEDIDHHIHDRISDTGVGGMTVKVAAARLASQWSVPTIIAEGSRAGTLTDIVSGASVGTLFVPRTRKLSARKQWIAVRSRSRGAVRVDDGAKRALVERGASLLPSGITAVEQDFPIGSRVDIQDSKGKTFAVGLVSYPSADIRRLCGRRVSEIKGTLGYIYVNEIIHRDDMVILAI